MYKSDPLELNPVFIIGAPRSGTNMLRDLITCFPGHITWPCDEINYIWRYGNRDHPSDEFTKDMLSEKSASYIKGKFKQLQKKNSRGSVIVEKTCANSLRVEYIDAIFPDAKYISIVRDGIDVVASAKARWKAELDIAYILRKAQFVPIEDMPYYAWNYLSSRLYKLFSGTQRLNVWGPKLNNMEDLVQRHSLAQICALQWQNCVDKAEYQFNEIDSSRILSIRYESFVNDPQTGVREIGKFLNVGIDEDLAKSLTNGISDFSVGKGWSTATEEELGELIKVIQPTLERLGYLKTI